MPRAPAIEDLPPDLQIRTLKVAADSGLEWMTGYGVWSLQFQSGDLLALRCFPSAGLGGFVTLWHQTPDLTWHMYVASETPESACPRYFGAVVTSAEQAELDGYIRAGDMIAILQSSARRKIRAGANGHG